MNARWAVGLAVIVLASACTSGARTVDRDTPPGPEPDVVRAPVDALQVAAARYATAVTRGDRAGAWGHLTAECQAATDRGRFDRRIDWMRRKIGGGTVEGVTAAAEGDSGTTSIAYSAGDGTIPPGMTWVLEGDKWRTDVCIPPKP